MTELQAVEGTEYEPPPPKEPGTILFNAYVVSEEGEPLRYDYDVLDGDGGGAFWVSEGIGFEYFLRYYVEIPGPGVYLIRNLTVHYTRGDGWTTDDDEDYEFDAPLPVTLALLSEHEKSKRAVEALRPFAEAARTLSSRWKDHETGWQSALSRRLTVGQLKAANDAISTLPPPALSPETTEGGAA